MLKHTRKQVTVIFFDCIHTHLIPHLCPFDGHSCRSVVVLDNCSMHHCAEVRGSLRDIGVIVHFLPLYSPDLNAIEEAFSKVKTELKSVEAQFMDTETALLASFATITVQAGSLTLVCTICSLDNNEFLIYITMVFSQERQLLVTTYQSLFSEDSISLFCSIYSALVSLAAGYNVIADNSSFADQQPCLEIHQQMDQQMCNYLLPSSALNSPQAP